MPSFREFPPRARLLVILAGFLMLAPLGVWPPLALFGLVGGVATAVCVRDRGTWLTASLIVLGAAASVAVATIALAAFLGGAPSLAREALLAALLLGVPAGLGVALFRYAEALAIRARAV